MWRLLSNINPSVCNMDEAEDTADQEICTNRKLFCLRADTEALQTKTRSNSVWTLKKRINVSVNSEFRLTKPLISPERWVQNECGPPSLDSGHKCVQTATRMAAVTIGGWTISEQKSKHAQSSWKGKSPHMEWYLSSQGISMAMDGRSAPLLPVSELLNERAL